KDTIGFKKEKHEKEKKAIRHLVKDLDDGLSNEIISVWDEFEAQETEESKFAKQLDKLEMVFQAQEYDKNSEESFDSFWESTEYILKHPKLIEVFKELKKQR
ncbi:MAG: HD domain-containing protein, partial [Nanoarchaeota archaeon]